MSIPVKKVVDVSISIGAVYPSRKGFGVLNAITAETGGGLDATTRSKDYADIDEVSVDWDGTEVEKLASSYFSQQPKPVKLKISFRGAGETITEALNAIEAFDDSFYGFQFTKEVRDGADINGEGVLEAAIWAEARVKKFFNTTNDTNVKVLNEATNIGAVLKAAGYARTITTYSSTVAEYPSASVAARAFTTNFEGTDTVITLKFKQLPGVTVEGLSSAGLTAISSHNVNAYIDVGGSFMYAESYMANGTFFDEGHGIDWLQEAIQNNVFGYLLTAPTKIAYTDKGVAGIDQQVKRGLDQGVTNGLLAAGTDSTGVYLSRGYSTTAIAVANVAQTDKDNRIYNGLSFKALGAGAIHGVQINGVFER